MHSGDGGGNGGYTPIKGSGSRGPVSWFKSETRLGRWLANGGDQANGTAPVLRGNDESKSVAQPKSGGPDERTPLSGGSSPRK